MTVLHRSPANEKGRKPLSSFSASTLAAPAIALLALAYVVPNHAPPWMSFVQEAVAAAALLLMAAVLLRAGGAVPWRPAEWLVLGLAAVPLLQFAFGQVAFLQTAWLGSLYLLGLLVALQAGAAWERLAPDRVLALLMVPVWVAAIVSVGLQLMQWLVMEPGVGTLWIYRPVPARPSANLGQPNSLATLLVLGLLATAWLWHRARLGAAVACGVAAYLLFGLAMTQSRAGLVNALLVAAALLAWRRGPRRPRALPVLALLGLLLAAFAAYPALSGVVDGQPWGRALVERSSADVRPLAWRLFLDALWRMPLAGYGWGQAFAAQMAAALDHASLGRVFLSAHNLVLDLALWCGAPIAAVVTAALALWWATCWRRADDAAARLLLLFVTVPLVHALFEYPLQYAYFLLPAGLAAGALNERLGLGRAWRPPAAVAVGLWLAAAVGLGVTVRDYLQVEESYRELLLDKAQIVRKTPLPPPEARVLDSLRELIAVSRATPRAGMAASELAHWADVLTVHPSPAGFARLAEALVLNGQPEAAQQRVDVLCRVFGDAPCAAQAAAWRTAAESRPALRAVRWP